MLYRKHWMVDFVMVHGVSVINYAWCVQGVYKAL